ncbi:mCG1032863, isoform CRA_a [Mus musculus]|nr:mCG1032863, isoform CRA_a [Mus musculus]EDL20963.1 mCG1032863, isoform CRA_a [Mus musculus]
MSFGLDVRLPFHFICQHVSHSRSVYKQVTEGGSALTYLTLFRLKTKR